MHEKLLKLKKKIIVYAGMATISTSLYGCESDYDMGPQKKIVSYYQLDEYDYESLNDIYLITAKNSLNEENYYATCKIDLENMGRSKLSGDEYFEDRNSYLKYLRKNEYTAMEIYMRVNYKDTTYLYIDILTGDIASIEYNKSTLNETNKEYLYNEIINEEPIINYLNTYYGNKNTYSYADINDMITDLNSKNLISHK